MDWDKDATEIVEAIPLPPMIAHFAKMDAERRAKKKGEKRVTAETARETEHGYEQALGKEAVELMRKMARGEDAGLLDGFFIEEPEDHYEKQPSYRVLQRGVLKKCHPESRNDRDEGYQPYVKREITTDRDSSLTL